MSRKKYDFNFGFKNDDFNKGLLVIAILAAIMTGFGVILIALSPFIVIGGFLEAIWYFDPSRILAGLKAPFQGLFLVIIGGFVLWVINKFI